MALEGISFAERGNGDEISHVMLAKFFAGDEGFGEVEFIAVGCWGPANEVSRSWVVPSALASCSACTMRPLELKALAQSGRCSM